jgi:hypothetical protein
MADINITATPIAVTIVQSGDPRWGLPFVRDPELDTIFYCDATDRLGNEDAGVIKLTLTPLGTAINKTIWPDPIEVTATPGGTFAAGVLVNPALLTIAVTLSSQAAALTELFKKHWVKWSNIGYLDFTIWKDNIAGERPLDWPGWVYVIKKLNNRVMAYGENGVSILAPAGSTYGLNTVHRLGLIGKQAVAGDDTVHFFIDKEGNLWSIGESLERLDYSEYLASLSNPVLSWDPENKLLYICDGTLGFIYSPADRGLGKGPVNITGLGYKDGISYAVAPIAISTPTFEVWTDIFDMGTRMGKGVDSIELGTDLAVVLKAAVRYRQDKAASFSQTDWATVTSEGIAFIQCYGQEFQFGVKADTYEYFELDYIQVNGKVYNLW